jgi:hypothetical protein
MIRVSKCSCASQDSKDINLEHYNSRLTELICLIESNSINLDVYYSTLVSSES